MNKEVYKFIENQVKQGYDLMGDRTKLAEAICEKFKYSNRNTVLNYISVYSRGNGYPKKHTIIKNKTQDLKATDNIDKRIFEGQKIKARIPNENKSKYKEHNGKILIITDRLIVLSLDVGYNVAINIAELIDPFNIILKIKEDGQYNDFNLKGYSINSKFTLKSLCKEC